MPDLLPVDNSGVIAEDTSAQVQTLYSGHTMTPTATFQFIWNGAILNFVFGDTQEVDPTLLAALTAAGAPFSQP